MDEKDRAFIESLLEKQARQSEQRFDELLNNQKTFAERMGRMELGLKQEIAQSERRLGALIEELDDKLGIVIEGQQMLGERVDRMDLELKEEIGKVDKRVTILALDLLAHRADS